MRSHKAKEPLEEAESNKGGDPGAVSRNDKAETGAEGPERRENNKRSVRAFRRAIDPSGVPKATTSGTEEGAGERAEIPDDQGSRGEKE